MYKYLLYIALLCINCMACSDDKDHVVPKSGASYFPVVPGQVRHYDVKEVTFNGVTSDTSTYLWQEQLVDSIVTGQSKSYTFQISKSTDGESWTADSSYMATITDRAVLLSHNNQKYVHLVFPVLVGTSWDGHAYNAEAEKRYRYEPIGSGEGLDTIDAESQMKVIISDVPANLVDQDERHEIYADGVGLVEKKYVQLNFCTVNCGGAHEVASGRVFIQKLRND